MSPRALVAAVLLCVGVVLVAASVGAQVDEERTDRSRRAYALAGELMSPFCPGRTLADCPSPNAAAWREEIRAWIHAGLGEDEIRGRLQARTSLDLSGLPRTPLGWALPLAILIGGLGVLVFVLRRMVAPAPAPVALDPRLEAELLRELEADEQKKG